MNQIPVVLKDDLTFSGVSPLCHTFANKSTKTDFEIGSRGPKVFIRSLSNFSHSRLSGPYPQTSSGWSISVTCGGSFSNVMSSFIASSINVHRK